MDYEASLFFCAGAKGETRLETILLNKYQIMSDYYCTKYYKISEERFRRTFNDELML